MAMTITITAEISAHTGNYYDYLDRQLLPRRVQTDVTEALESALDAIKDGAERITVPIRSDGDKVGTLTVEES